MSQHWRLHWREYRRRRREWLREHWSMGYWPRDGISLVFPE